MKKTIVILLLLSLTLINLCSCSLLLSSLSPKSNVESLGDWSFEYDDIPDYYLLYFSFKDKDGEYVVSDADVDIRIVDDDKNELYNGTISVSKSDFVIKQSMFYEKEKTLAEIRIKAADIKKGTSGSGVVYFTVHKNNAFSFKEQYIRVYADLPVE